MKRVLIRAISLAVCIVVVISCVSFSTSAAKVTFKSGNAGVSDAYKNSKYYKNLTQIELTGDGVTDVLAVALSQLEYVEGTNTSGFSGTQGGGENYTEYCRNYGEGNAYAWCAAYVSFCLFQSGATSSTEKQTIWRDIYCPRWYQNLKNAGYGHDASSNYTPKSGDLVFFTGGGHIGIVRYYKNGTVYTIEGNTSNSAGLNPEGGGVYCKSYSRDYHKFLGFGSMPYKKNDKALKVDYSGENPTPGLWISSTTKYLYPDTKMSNSSNYSEIPKGTFFEVIEIVNKTCFKAKYNGKTGYVSVNSASPIYQATSTGPAEPPVEKNTYYIDKDIKKISGHFGSGIDKYYVDTKGSTKAKTSYDLEAGQKIGIEGFAGFDSFAKAYGYYFDGNAESAVWDSTPLDPDPETKKKGGDKTTEFKIMADTNNLTNGEHTVTFAIKLLNKKEHPLVTLKLNITGASENAGQETLPPDEQESEDISDILEETEDNGGCADDMETDEVLETDENGETEDFSEETLPEGDSDALESDENVSAEATSKKDEKADTEEKTTSVGCGAAVGVVVGPMMFAAAVLMLKKKKED